ncbi:ATPase P [Achromatium sp. WMS3]|nr:ATPase P [Achromatium sp. WMS3]
MKYNYTGLDDAAIIQSRHQHGSNALTPQETETFWDKLWGNFQDPTIIVLMISLVIVVILAIFGLTPWYEGVGIAFAVVIATGVATWSEHKNEGTFQKLLEEASQITVKVFRNGSTNEIGINDLVVGDYVLLQPGDKVPADGSIVAGKLQVDQASLTGESEYVEKTSQPANAASNTGDLHDPHLVFRGSVVADGEAVINLQTVGDQTQYGKLAQDLQDSERDSPLKVKLKQLANGIGTFGTIGAVLIALAFMFKKLFLDHNLTLDTILPYLSVLANWPALFTDAVQAVILAIIIIVVAVPEGLPMMVAIVLSINMRKLLTGKVLVRKLLGIEAAGSLNLLFTDKTGTLTKGELQVATLVTGDCEHYNNFTALSGNLQELVTRSLRYNTIAVIDTSQDGSLKIVGADRTEQALLQYIEPALNTPNTENLEIVDAIAFNAERKFSAVRVAGDQSITFIKGAPEILLAQCTDYWDINGTKREFSTTDKLNEALNVLASERSMRLLALATSDVSIDSNSNILPAPLSLVGVVGLRDELREESYTAVSEAQNAGIQVVMITGDRKETAHAIAKDVGLLEKKEISDNAEFTSAEIEDKTDEELQKILPQLRVVSRAYPHTKSRLVKVGQDLGLVVGMTGDGVNDAAALKRADVGFSMGSGTEVAKEAGDIVILDDNFASITRAVLYGRTLFKSIRKFLVFQLTVNVAAILVAFLGPFLGIDLPLTMTQLLWINLIMDTLAALAFSGEAALTRYMAEPPIPRNESLISSDMWWSILFNGFSIAGLSIIFLKYPPIQALFHSDKAFLTGFFGFFVFIHNFNKFNTRTERLNLQEHIFENKGFLAIVGLIFGVQIIFTYLGGEVLRTVGLTMNEWLYILAFSCVIIPLDLLRKSIRNYLGYDPSLRQPIESNN